MYRREPRHQLSFEDFFLPFGGKLSGDNRWIKLAELIPWDELEDDCPVSTTWAGAYLIVAKQTTTRLSSARDLVRQPNPFAWRWEH